jgi:Co/Zn/Cd efflux system component
MLALVIHGHVRSCPALKKSGGCICENRQYLFTGTLAFIAGIMQAMVGYRHSMAVLSDSLHALADGMSDFWAARIALKVHKNHGEEYPIRENGDKIIAVIMVLGACWILYEVFERWTGDGYAVSAGAIFFVGIATTILHNIRIFSLKKAQRISPNRTRKSILLHAYSDRIHTVIVAIVGGVLYWAEILASQGLNTLVRPADLILSAGLAGYMIYLSYQIWTGKHDHEHADDHHH